MKLRTVAWSMLLSVCAAQTATAACPAPGPYQAVVYEGYSGTGTCQVLPLGAFTSFAPVRNDQIRSVWVGSNARAILYKDGNFQNRAQHAHADSGWLYNGLGNADAQTSSVRVIAASGGSVASYFLGDSPSDSNAFWAEGNQGIAHDDERQNWFITTTSTLYKVPFSYSLASGSPPAGQPTTSVYAACASYNHFGDADQLGGFVFVPIESEASSNRPMVAIFDASNLRFLAAAAIPAPPNKTVKNAGWVAINPRTWTLWTSAWGTNTTDGLREYWIDWNRLYQMRATPPCATSNACAWCPNAWNQPLLTLRAERFPRNHDGGIDDVRSMQGGVFNSEGTHFYMTNGYCEDVGGAFPAIRVYDADTLAMQAESANGYGPFNYQISVESSWLPGCGGEEPEGLDFVDVAGRGVPGILEGQLHAAMINNDAGTDQLYFKHYVF